MTYEKPRYSVDRQSARVKKKRFIIDYLKQNKKAQIETNNELFRAARKERKRKEREERERLKKELK